MRLHRFYTGKDLELRHDFWLHDLRLIHQWRNVLRMAAGQEVVLFDGVGEDRLYKIVELTDKEAHLEMVTELARKTPAKEVYLFWSLLKKDKNDWVLQKCTELGVSHFIPLLAERSEKKGFNLERSQKIVIEAAEQCGRSDIPAVREPITIQTAVTEFKDKISLMTAEQTTNQNQELGIKNNGEDHLNSEFVIRNSKNPVGILIGPEGGWSDAEKQLFSDQKISYLNLHDFTLRAETAAIAAINKMIS